jgi:hypothetical protein
MDMKNQNSHNISLSKKLKAHLLEYGVNNE